MQQQRIVDWDEANIHLPFSGMPERKKKHALLVGGIVWLWSLLPVYSSVAHLKQKAPVSEMVCFHPLAWESVGSLF